MKKIIIFILGILVIFSIYIFGFKKTQQEEPLKTTPPVTQKESRMQLIDAHVLVECTNDKECMEIEKRLLSEMDKEGISKVVLGDALKMTPEVDKMIIKMADRHPDKFIPFLSGFKPDDPSSVEYVKTQLKTGKWKGIGKIILRHSGRKDAYKPNDPVMDEIYKLAEQFNKPVFFHNEPASHPDGCKAGVEEMTDVLKKYPNVKFIWHTGQSFSEGLEGAGCSSFIEDYPNLIAEEELHHSGSDYSDYQFNPRLIQEKRVMIGSDIILSVPTLTEGYLGTAGGATYHETMENVRKVLSKYPEQTAKDIGYNNILSIIGNN